MENRRKLGILYQIYVLVVIGLIVIGLGTYFTQHHLKETSVNMQTGVFMEDVAGQTIATIEEYPAYEWLLRYWYENADKLDVEYDVDYSPGTATEEKCRLFSSRHPEMQIKYMDESDVESLSEEDQKLYAEIVYTWLTNDINKIKQHYHISFLFCLVTGTDGTDDAYQTQFFLLSGADPGAKRGTNYEEVYPLGKVSVIKDNKSQQNAMRAAVRNVDSNGSAAYMAYAGKYMDYYAYVCSIDENAVLVGLTYDLSTMMDDVHEQTVQSTAQAILFQILLLALIMLLMYLAVLKPLKNVLKNIRMYTKTKDRAVVTKNLSQYITGPSSIATRYNEIGRLSEDIIELADEIDDYVNKIGSITAEKERIETELELASRIQSNMLPNQFPPFPENDEFDIYATMTPAKEVGGDFYDFFKIDDDHLGIVMADVSGKGVPAALFMMGSKIMIRNLAISEGDPAKALEATNNEICQNNREEMFVTVWLGILELSTGRLVAANAGHEYPAYKPASGRFSVYRDEHGFIIGGMEDMLYSNYEIRMEPGSKLFLYTDGLTEATNGNNELFGEKRMVEALRGVEDSCPNDILNKVNESVKEFVGDSEQFDDLTMLCVEFNGRKAD